MGANAYNKRLQLFTIFKYLYRQKELSRFSLFLENLFRTSIKSQKRTEHLKLIL